MLYYDRIDVSEEIDVSKRIGSKACDIYHYCYFLDKGFNFKSMMSMNLNDIAFLTIHGVDYCCAINGLNKVRP